MKRWNVSLEIARKTFKSTIRLCKRNTEDVSLNRCYNNNDRMLRYNRLMSKTFTDTMFASKRCPSFRGYTKRDVDKAVKRFFKDVGVPSVLILDRAGEKLQELQDASVIKRARRSRN